MFTVDGKGRLVGRSHFVMWADLHNLSPLPSIQPSFRIILTFDHLVAIAIVLELQLITKLETAVLRWNVLLLRIGDIDRIFDRFRKDRCLRYLLILRLLLAILILNDRNGRPQRVTDAYGGASLPHEIR